MTSPALPDCGTINGYYHHRRLGQDTCPSCVLAKRIYSRAEQIRKRGNYRQTIAEILEAQGEGWAIGH